MAQDNTKHPRLATFALGSVFLLVKAFEYNSKFAHGIYPSKPHSLIYEKPDVYYAAAVRDTLENKALEYANLDTEGDLSEEEMWSVLRNATIDRRVVPVYCGSLLKNKGIQRLLDGGVEKLQQINSHEQTAG